tara:strand:+ start:167 stop:832 length:666 start_codon:yes stop_codon:yes gene_type:complete
MDVEKNLIFNKHIGSITIEKQLRLEGLNKFDKNSNILWRKAIKTVNNKQKNKLILAYNHAQSISYNHSGLSSEIYLAHPIRVASLAILLSSNNPVEVGIIGLFHNVLEVSKTSEIEIKKKYGGRIHNIISKLTVNRSLQWDPSYKQEYYYSINQLPQNARIVKVIDKFDNLFLLGLNQDKEVRFKYLSEIKTHVMPILKNDLPFLETYFNELILHCEQTEK